MDAQKFKQFGSVRDVLEKDFNAGTFSVNIKTKAEALADINISSKQRSSSENETTIDARFPTVNQLLFQQKLQTSGVANSKVKGEVWKNAYVSAGLRFFYATNQAKLKLKANYHHPNVNVTATLRSGLANPTLQLPVVFQYQNWQWGADVVYDYNQCELKNYGAGLQYKNADTTLCLKMLGDSTSSKKVNLAIIRQVNSRLAIALDGSLNLDNKSISATFGSSYKVDSLSTLKVKLDHAMRLGLAFMHQLKPGVKVSLGGHFDLKNLDQPNHKVGLGLDFEAY